MFLKMMKYSLIILMVMLIIMETKPGILFWIFMELLMILFLFVLYEKKENFKKWSDFNKVFLEVFIYQISGSLIILSTLYQSSIYLEETITTLMLLTGFSLKMSIFPFHHWFLKIAPYMEKTMIFMFQTIMKVPFFTMCMTLHTNIIYMILIMNNILGAYIMMKKWSKISNLIGGSAIYFNLWIYESLRYSLMTTVLMIVNYFLVMHMLIYNWNMTNFSKTVNKKMMFMISLIFLLGLPPMMLFFIKNMIIQKITITPMSKLYLVIIWSTTMMSTYGYFKYFLNSMWNIQILKNKIVKNSKTFLVYTYLTSMIFSTFVF